MKYPDPKARMISVFTCAFPLSVRAGRWYNLPWEAGPDARHSAPKFSGGISRDEILMDELPEGAKK